MGEFWYSVEASRESAACYIGHLLRTHGLAYHWRPQVTPELQPATIRIAVGSGSITQTEKFQPINQTEVILTTNEQLLQDFGFDLTASCVERSAWGYISSLVSQERPYETIPFPLAFTVPLRPPGSTWTEECLLLGANRGFNVVAATRTVAATRQTVFSVDIFAFLDRCMLGPPATTCSGLEDWAEAYGIDMCQSLCDTYYVDRFLCLITDLLTNNFTAAFPAKVWYYPPTKTAPLIITGDTDDATQSQLSDYLETLESYQTKGSVIIKEFGNYSDPTLKAAMARGHCFGIHPYSTAPGRAPFSANYDALFARHRRVFNTPVYGVRNHRFQWISRTTSVELERETHVYFDLNCVAASGSTWLGSPSGIGFPIPFPPSSDRFSKYPRLLPTVLEDDVLLFSFDYCYRPLISGDCLPIEAALRFLEDWLIVKNRPAVLNLHPEHITPEKRWLLDAILLWVASMNVWTPSLQEFASWINARDEVDLEVSSASDYDLSVTSQVPVVLISGSLDGDEGSRLTVAKGARRVAFGLVPHTDI